MAGDRHCGSCGRDRALRWVEILIQVWAGGVQSVRVRLCGACTVALLDSVQHVSLRQVDVLIGTPER